MLSDAAGAGAQGAVEGQAPKQPASLLDLFAARPDPAQLAKAAEQQHRQHAARIRLERSMPSTPELRARIQQVASIAEMHRALLARAWTCRHVVSVLGMWVLHAHERTAAVSEMLLCEALEAADVLDAHVRATGRLVGPLHGVLFVLTDDCDIMGVDTTLGCACRCMQPRMQDAPIVRSIKALGGIVLCKAAVPWHLLFSDVSSPVFGTAVHPDKPHLSLGGSGGAMCALIAMSEETDGSSHRRRPAHPGGGSGGAATPSRGRGHCCLVGIGGDEIGGVRIAAQHCGQFALKPSSARLPCGTHDSAWDTLVRVASPASSSLASIVHVVRSLAVPEIQHREPGTVPLAFNQPAFESASCPDRPLRIGYIVNDGVMHASPASKRAVLTAISAIQAHGRSRPTRIEHQAIRISPPNPPAHRPPPDYGFLSAADHLQSVDDVVSPPNGLVLLAKLFSYGRHRATQATKCLGRVSLRDQLTRIEPVFPLLLLMRVPQLVRSLASRLMSALLDDAVLASVVRFFGGSPSWAWLAPRSAESLEQLEREKQALARLYADMWEHHKLDAIVCPVHACPPLSTVATPFVWTGSFYSAVWNLLDYAAGVVPNVTRVQPTDLVGNVVEYAHAGHSMLPAEPLPLLPAMPPTAQLAPGALESQQHRLRAAQYDPARHARARIFNFLGVLGIEESNHSTMDGSAVGCGVGVQVVCRRFEEENVVGVMSVIEQGLRMVETDS